MSKRRNRKLKDRPTYLESIPIKALHSDSDLERRLTRSVGFTTITRKTTGIVFDVFIQHLCGDCSPFLMKYSIKDTEKRYLPPVRLVWLKREDVDSPSLKIFLHPFL